LTTLGDLWTSAWWTSASPPVDPGTDDPEVMFDVEHRNDLAALASDRALTSELWDPGVGSDRRRGELDSAGVRRIVFDVERSHPIRAEAIGVCLT